MSEPQAPMTGAQPSLLPWTLSFLRPHRRRVWLIAVLLLAQVGLGALEPWVLMFTLLLKKDVVVALLSRAVVPFLYLSIRYYKSTLMVREERVKELESSLVQQLYETFAAMRLVKSFARERHEAKRFSAAGDKTMD